MKRRICVFGFVWRVVTFQRIWSSFMTKKLIRESVSTKMVLNEVYIYQKSIVAAIFFHIMHFVRIWLSKLILVSFNFKKRIPNILPAVENKNIWALPSEDASKSSKFFFKKSSYNSFRIVLEGLLPSAFLFGRNQLLRFLFPLWTKSLVSR